MSLTRDNKAREVVVDSSDEIDEESIPLLERRSDSDNEVSIEVFDHHQPSRELIRSLILDSIKINFSRISSLGAFATAWQLFIRENPVNLRLAADFANINAVVFTIRQSMWFITPETKIAFETGNETDQRNIFLTAYVASIPTSAALWACIQSYTLTLPLLGREPAVCDTLKWIPTKFFANYFLAQVLASQMTYAYGRKHLGAMLVAFAVGGMIMLTYPFVRLVDTSLDGFFLLNLGQNIAIVGIYLGYLQFFYGKERLLQACFDYRSWYPAFIRGLKIIKSGLQPAAILAIEQLASALITFTIRRPEQLAAFQALSFIPGVFYNVTVSIESYLSGKTVEMMNPSVNQEPKRELKRLLVHSSWIGSILPAAFFILAIYFNKPIIDFLVKPTEENAVITSIVEKDFMLVASLPLVRSLRGNAYGMVTGFKQSNEPFHHRQNTIATMVNSAAAIFALILGVVFDYGFEWGAHGYWLGALIMLSLSALAQFFLVSQCIGQTPKSNISSQASSSVKLSTSPHQFWSRGDNVVPAPKLVPAITFVKN